MAFSKGLDFLDVNSKKKVIQNRIIGSKKYIHILLHKHKNVVNPLVLRQCIEISVWNWKMSSVLESIFSLFNL